MINIGDIELGKVVYIPFNTFDSDGASVTVSDLANTDVKIHKDGAVGEYINYDAITVHIDFDGITGCHQVEIDTGDSSSVADFEEGSDFKVRLEGITVDSQTLNPWIGMFSIVNRAGNVTHINRDKVAVDNLEAQYDETGLSGDTFPATQAQVNNIGAASGGSVNINISEDNTGGVIDPSSAVFAGSVQGGTTFANLEAEDGVVHDIDDNGNDIDIVYGASVGGGRTASLVSIIANVDGNADEIKVKAYDHVGGDWEIIGTLEGSGGTAFKALDLDLLLKHTGTGAELGKVYIRFETDSTTPSNLSIDKLLVKAVSIGQSVGYAIGRIWVDTNNGVAGTEAFVNGVADNPTNLIASAKNLSTSVKMSDFQIINGSTITLAESTVNESYFGDNWTLALGSQDVDGAYFQGAQVTGVGTSATKVHYEGCNVGTMSVQKGHFDFCAFGGTVTMTLAGDYEYHNCYSNVAGAGAPTFTKTAGQAITAEWRNWMDSITVSGLQSGDTITINGRLGTVTLNGADATVEIRGSYKSIVNNLTGSPTVNIDGAWQGSDIADILVDTTEIGAGIDKLDSMIVEDSAGNYFTEEALAEAPTAEMDADELHTALDSYSNKNDYKATGFNTTVPDAAGVAPTASEIQAEMEQNGASFLDTIKDAIQHGTYGLSAIRTRGDAAWITGGGGALSEILSVQPLIPNSVDLANTIEIRLALALTNMLDDLPSDSEIDPGTISIDRKAIGATGWTNIVNNVACSEVAGLIYYDEVFNAGTGYAEGDSLRITFKNQVITVDANEYEITGNDGWHFQTFVRQTMVGTNSANTAVPDVAGTAAGLHGTTDGKIDGLVTPDAAGTAAGLHSTTDGKVDDNKDILDKLDPMIVEDSAGNEFTTEALANAPTGSGGDATLANQTTLLSRIGTPVNIDSGGADLSNNIKKLADDNAGATFDAAQHSLWAIRTRGDAAWITGGGGGITDILNIETIIPNSVDLANTATVRLGMGLTNMLDDLPTTVEITPGTITIERKARGGTVWATVVNAAACSEAAGLVYYDEVFDAGTGYAEGDSIRITFKNQKITVAANDYEITGTDGWAFQTFIREAGTTAAEVVTTLMADTGFTSGGTMTFAEQIRIAAAWNAGNWRNQPGSTTVRELLDADDGTTVVLRMTLSETSPFRTITII